MDGQLVESDDYEAALAEYMLRWEEVKAAARRHADPFAAFAALAELAGDLRGFRSVAAGDRADAARQIYEDEGLTFAELGKRLGMSRARAHRLVTGAGKGSGRRPVPPVPALAEVELGELVPAAALYRLWRADDTLLYVGITDNLKVRFDLHKREKPWWSDVARVTVTWYGSRRDALTAETIAINAEHPVHNKAGMYSELTPA